MYRVRWYNSVSIISGCQEPRAWLCIFVSPPTAVRVFWAWNIRLLLNHSIVPEACKNCLNFLLMTLFYTMIHHDIYLQRGLYIPWVICCEQPLIDLNRWPKFQAYSSLLISSIINIGRVCFPFVTVCRVRSMSTSAPMSALHNQMLPSTGWLEVCSWVDLGLNWFDGWSLFQMFVFLYQWLLILV